MSTPKVIPFMPEDINETADDYPRTARERRAVQTLLIEMKGEIATLKAQMTGMQENLSEMREEAEKRAEIQEKMLEELRTWVLIRRIAYWGAAAVGTALLAIGAGPTSDELRKWWGVK